MNVAGDPLLASNAPPFLPTARMRGRCDLARDESDTAYFFDLLYFGEMVLKLLVVELVASVTDDREHHRYALEYRLVRADGLGEWADVLDEVLTGPASQHLLPEARESQRQLATLQGPGAESWQRAAVDQLVSASRCLEAEVENTSQRRVCMRIWARQFVWLRNRTRGHGAPKAEKLSEVCPLLEASVDAVALGAPAFRRSWAHLRQSLSGKYRVSPFGGPREPFNYLAREATHNLPNGAYVFLGKPVAARLLITDSDLTDFFLPNGNFRDGKYELLSYITDERRLEEGSKYLLPALAQPASETSAVPALDCVGNVFSNMPPRREGYVKRETLESELAGVLEDDRHPVVTLLGRGGVGKTSLALAVLHELAMSDRYFAIVWFSARDIDLLPHGPKIVRPDILSIEDIARDFWKIMHSTEATPFSASLTYLAECLSGVAADGPFVFVLDNFETIRDQAAVYTYLDNTIRLPNKLLITTRTRDFKADYPIEVRGMNRDEFRILVSETAGRLGIASLVDDRYEEQLFEESDGHPYITKVLLGEVAQEKRQVSLKRVLAAKDAMLEALFERSFAALSYAAQRVFLTLCSWRSLVPRVGLEAVLLRPGNSERIDVSRALDELEQTSLVEMVHREGTHEQYLSVPLAASIFGKKKLVTSPLKIAIDADLELIRGFGAASTTDVAHGLGLRVKQFGKAIAARADEGEDVTQYLAVLQYIATAHPPAWLVLAELQQYQLKDFPGAIASTKRYLEEHQDDKDAWGRLIGLYRASGDAVGEMHARLQQAELIQPDYSELSAAANRLNGMLYSGELFVDADERRLIVRRLRRLMETRSEEADATALSRLAWLCLHDHDRSAAIRWTLLGHKRDPHNEHIQKLRYRLGLDTTEEDDKGND